MTTDKTGAETAVSQEADRFSISVDGQPVGVAEFADRDGQRVFSTPRSMTSSEAAGSA